MTLDLFRWRLARSCDIRAGSAILAARLGK